MNQRPDRVWDLFFLRKKNNVPTQLHPVHSFVYQVETGVPGQRFPPRTSWYMPFIPGHQKCGRFHRRINRAGTLPLKQVKSGLNSQAKIPTFSPFRAARSHARPSDTLSVVHMGGIDPDCRVFDVSAGMAISNILNTKEIQN